MKKFYVKHKKIINIILNIFLFFILFYFADLSELAATFLSMNYLYFFLGTVFTFIFTAFSGARWMSLTDIITVEKNKKNLFPFVRASFRKEFFASFTSGLVGDVYSVFAISHVGKKDVAKSVFVAKYYDLITVLIICVVISFFKGYINFFIAILGVLFFVLMIIFLEFVFNKLLFFLKKIHYKADKVLSSMDLPNFKEKNIIFLFISTLFLWTIRYFAAFFAVLALNANVSVVNVIAITFFPIIASIVAFFLPKTVSGDSATVGIGLFLGINYPVLIGYVVIHRIYSLLTAVVGFFMGFTKGRISRNSK